MSNRGRDLLKDREHLFRMAGIFIAGILLFFALQRMFVPSSFGAFGHYRGDAIDESAAKPLVHAGRAACAGCHAEQASAQKAGKHARLGCEGCHGALARHAANPVSEHPRKLDTKRLCPTCHAMNSARPEWFKQVNVQEHSSGEACNTCHQPHAPQM